MSLKNTQHNYGTIAKWLHWSIALLFLGAYCAVYYRHWFTVKDTPANLTALQLHLSFGVSVVVIVILRIIWRIMNVQPVLEPASIWLHRAAHLGHYALYAVMIIMPVSGYIGTGVNTDFFFMFSLPKFEETALFKTVVFDGLGLTFKEFEKPVDFVHKEIMGAWLVWILILGHISAALYHHYVKHDRTLSKMTTGQ